MTRPATSDTSWLSVRGRTVPWLMIVSGTSSSVTWWTRTPGGGMVGACVATGGRLLISTKAATNATPTTASGRTICRVRRSARFMVLSVPRLRPTARR